VSDPFDADQTIRFTRPTSRPKSRLLVPALALTALLAAGCVTWVLLRPPTQIGFAVPPAPQALAGLDAPLADEATILAAHAADLLVFRFRDAPSVLVLSFPSLNQQGEMLDRIAAFVEKAGLPRDRVLTDAELDAAIRQSGDTRETYYYGHDYRADDLVRFFAAADRYGVALHPEERRLRVLLDRAGMLAPKAGGALITLPPEVESELIDATSRATILRHELSHGLYFTDPVYAAYARNFWRTVLNDTQRGGFRRFLASEGYDTANEDLMLNETQAFLVHTEDKRYFLPDHAGLSETEAALLRQRFVRDMPEGWLKTAAQVAKSRSP
jgi:hypothetical protein